MVTVRPPAAAVAERAEAAKRWLRRTVPFLDDPLEPPPAAGPGEVTGPPDFVGVGAMKAGTTWWYWLLAAHPQIHHPPGAVKERHFLDSRWAEALDEPALAPAYARLFPRPPGTITGEWTPRYLPDWWTIPSLARAAGEARILVMLRDPVERYRSALTHKVARGARPKVRRDLAAAQYVRGLYDEQLTRLADHFPAERVLVLQYERCRADPRAELARTYRFLDVDDTFVPDALTEVVNGARGPRWELAKGQREALAAAYSADVGRLVRRVPDLDLSLWPNFRNLVT